MKKMKMLLSAGLICASLLPSVALAHDHTLIPHPLYEDITGRREHSIYSAGSNETCIVYYYVEKRIMECSGCDYYDVKLTGRSGERHSHPQCPSNKQ